MGTRQYRQFFWLVLGGALLSQAALAYFMYGDSLMQPYDIETYNAVGAVAMLLLALAAIIATMARAEDQLLLIAAACTVAGTIAHQLFGHVTSPNQALLTAAGLPMALTLFLVVRMVNIADRVNNAAGSAGTTEK